MRIITCCLLLLGGVRTAAEPPQHLREILDKFPHQEPYDAVSGTPNSISATYGTAETMEAVVEFYTAQLADGGWTVEVQRVREDFSYFALEKGSLRGNVHIDNANGVSRFSRSPRTTIKIDLVDRSVEHCRTDADPPEDPAARELLNEVIAHYATLDSYRDRGGQRTKFSTGHTNTLQFETVFERPRQFRFEFESDGHTYVIHQNGDTVQTYWTVTGKLEEDKTIDMVLGGAHGVSGGTCTTLADLLGVREDGSGWSQLRDLQLLEEQAVQGVLCMGIQGFDYKCSPTTLWIGKDDLFLRRIEDGAVLPGFTTEETTDYEPEANIELTAEDLAFDQEGRLPKSSSRSEGMMGIFRWIFGG